VPGKVAQKSQKYTLRIGPDGVYNRNVLIASMDGTFEPPMTQCFTFGWKHREMLRYPDGAAIPAAWGSRFSQQGMVPGDVVYLMSVHHGRVHLLGKMIVQAVTFLAEDYRRLVGTAPPPAVEYLIADSFTPARLVHLSDEQARALRFRRGEKRVPLKFRETGVDPQSLRGLRRLTAESAVQCDRLLPPLQGWDGPPRQ